MKKFSILLFFALAFFLSPKYSSAQHHTKEDWMTPCAKPGVEENLEARTIRLWETPAPESHGADCEDTPTLTILKPQDGQSTGSAVIILPGGAYAGLAGNIEGRQFADWFAARGFTAFILNYRLTSDGYVLPIPLYDARRAVQLVRSHAADFHIAPNRIVMIGFSAGGHLAALAGTQFVLPNSNEANPASADPIDHLSSRPDFLILGYPWIGAISSDTSHLTYCKLFNLMDRCEALRLAYSPDLYVTKQTPPTFIYHTFDDDTVPVEQPLRFYEALVKAGVPSELHIFAHGQHGSGLGMGDPALDQWPVLLETWLRANGLLSKSK